ncbi:hypothetical protein IHQ11_26165 [Priestia megaterium]|uniref:tubby C-terminal domain-like protein n=1 Tax=Priestia megaterium TaxID=1404 RepID=UPI001B3A2C2C|nr:hypothetical protein [Priestia megaterium]MBQ4869940.1 hypothetical protein [Priestia megaterium]
MQEYIFYLPYFKSAGKTVAVTNENGENVGKLKRMHKNMWTKSIDFLTRDGLPVLDSISWFPIFSCGLKVHLQVQWEGRTVLIDHVKKHRWVIKENGKTVGDLLGKGIIKNEGQQEIRWGNNVYMLSSHEAVEEACIFNQKREKVAEFKTDLFHFKEGKHSIRVIEELPVPIFIASYYTTTFIMPYI